MPFVYKVSGCCCIVIVAAIGVCAASSQAAFLTAEPDNYAVNTAIPDNIGVKLRNASYRPGHSEFDRSWRRIYAKDSSTQYPYAVPSTGSLVLGNDYSAFFNGYDYGLRAWFVDTANTFQPTSYVGFDICWPTASGWAEGARVTAYGDNIAGTEVAIFDRIYAPSGTKTSVDLFIPGIKWLKIICYDKPNSFAQMAFTVDNFEFTDQSGTAFAVADDENIQAPTGMTLNNNDFLSGNGTVTGDVTSHGSITPGTSPGQLTIDGDYDQQSDGSLVIEIAGGAPALYDQLLVTGTATLGGTLNVVLDGYLPASGETFTIMTYADHLLAFDALVVTGGSVAFTLDYLATSIVLTAVPEPATLAPLTLGGLAMLKRRR